MIPADLPDLIGGKYRPLGVIGVGAMGIVYSVEHTLTGEQLAVKVMTSHHGASREAIERFKREARASSKIKSEHVVRVIDADVAPELDGAPFIVMELLVGSDLEERASQAHPERAEVVEWLGQIALAIDKAHGLGIVHRDLKPENIFLTKRDDGTPFVKVLDFGIVKMIEEGSWVTASDEVLGTPAYMAPEQATAGGVATPATDLYALGLVAYRLLAGERYYRGDVAVIVTQLLHEPMAAPSSRHPELGPAFDAWFARACHRTPAQRFPSAAEQVEALARALGVASETAEIPRGRPLPPPATSPRSARLWLGLIVVAAAAIAVALAFR
jgi:eukaryotic-like serine/threonine-protein kinase